MLQVNDTVKLIDDYKELREKSSYRQREFYCKLANPDKVYKVEFITALDEVYLEGITNYFKSSLLERV